MRIAAIIVGLGSALIPDHAYWMQICTIICAMFVGATLATYATD